MGAILGNIGSHVDLTSGRRGHQAKPATAVAFRHTPARALGRQGPGISMFAGAKGISRQLSTARCQRGSAAPTGGSTFGPGRMDRSLMTPARKPGDLD